MRIAYGVHGYGRGHATRSLATISDLIKHHEVTILAGGDAYDTISPIHPVLRIPTAGYAYRTNGTRSDMLTFTHNFPLLADLTFHGPSCEMVQEVFTDLAPDVIITDAEPLTSHVGKRMGIPRISFDHFGVMAYTRPRMSWIDRVLSWRDVKVYRWLMQKPERIIVSSFYRTRTPHDNVYFVGTLLRPEVFEFVPHRGDHILVYLNKGMHLFSRRMAAAFAAIDAKFIVYGTGRTVAQGRIEFRPASNRAFLQDLAGCRAVISTAGNQLVGEALHYGKPMLVMPEDAVEQRINANGLEDHGIGMQVAQRKLTGKVIQRFLDREDDYLTNIRKLVQDGRQEAVEMIERCITELTGKEPPASTDTVCEVA